MISFRHEAIKIEWKSNRYIGKGYIIQLESLPVFIIKQGFKKMSQNEVKQSVHGVIRKNLTQIRDEWNH